MSKKTVLMILFGIVIISNCQKKTNIALPKLIPYTENSIVWGFCDKNKNVVIKPVYEYVEPFVNGFARVSKDDKFGFINEEGKEIVPLKYNLIKSPFNRSLVAVGKKLSENESKEKKSDYIWAYVNNNGEEIIPFGYIDARSFTLNRALVKKYLKKEDDFAWGYIDQNGKEVTKFIYDFRSESFFNGLARVGISKRISGSNFYNYEYNYFYSFIDTSGNVIIPPEKLNYSNIEVFQEERALVRNDKYGFIDTSGDLVIPMIYKDARHFREGLAAVKLEDKWGFIDKNGDTVIDFKYSYVHPFNEGLARIAIDTTVSNLDYVGYIDKSGELFLPYNYFAGYSFVDSIAVVKIRGRSNYSVINRLGKELFSFDEKLEYFNYVGNGLFEVGVNRNRESIKIGYVDIRGKEYY